MKVFIVASLTADGFIGRTDDHLVDWSSREDKQLFIHLTKAAGTMVMGSKTFATIGRGLPGRTTIVYTRKPSDFPHYENVQATDESPKDLVERLRAQGMSGLAICGGSSIYGQFMAAGVVDELYLTFEPVLFGAGIALFDTPLHQDLALLESTKLNDNTVLLHYAVKR